MPSNDADGHLIIFQENEWFHMAYHTVRVAVVSNKAHHIFTHTRKRITFAMGIFVRRAILAIGNRHEWFYKKVSVSVKSVPFYNV